MSSLFYFSLLNKTFCFCSSLSMWKKKALLVVDPWGPPMCLCSGPGSDSGVNKGLVSLFVSAQLYGFPFTLFFRRVILVSPRGSWMLGTRIYSLADLSLFALCTGNPALRWPLASPDMVSSRPDLGVLTKLCFHDPGHFKAGMLHESFPVWQRLLADYSCAVDLLEILRDGVRVENFFTPFRGRS